MRLLETEVVEECPGCGSGRSKLWRDGCRDRAYRPSTQRFSYARCCRCGLVFLQERPLEREIHKAYPKDYAPYRDDGRIRPSHERRAYGSRISAYAAKSARVVQYLLETVSQDRLQLELEGAYTPEKPGLKLIDFGCGTSMFLDIARAKGWDAIGADFSEEVVRRVRQTGHEAYLVDEWFWQRFADASVSVIRMNHVLEHLYNPSHVLHEARRRLTSEGILHIAVPNVSGMSAIVFGNRWWPLDCPRHIMHYSPATLMQALKRSGFKQVQVIHQSLTKDFIRSCGYVLHDLGRVSNQGVVALAEDPKRTEMLAPLGKLAAMVRRGDRIHAFARR